MMFDEISEQEQLWALLDDEFPQSEIIEDDLGLLLARARIDCSGAEHVHGYVVDRAVQLYREKIRDSG